jgi:iron complex outermembrane receptor protein
MKRFCAVVSGLTVVLFLGSAGGQDLSGSDSTVVLDEMVVTASRLPESVNSVPADVTVVTTDDIAGSTAKNVAELLRAEGGIHVNDITGVQRNYTVDLRGFGETAGLNTLVLVDGRRTNQVDLSGTDWAQIPLERVERIEIVRGGRAGALYGDNAAGGVINIITKKGTHNDVGGEVAAGSYSTYKASVYATGAVDAFSYSFSGSYRDTDGYRDNSENEVKDFGADLGYAYGEVMVFNLSAGYHEDTAGLPGAITETALDTGVSRTDSVYPDNYADYEDFYLMAGPELAFGSSKVKLDVSRRNRETESHSSGEWGYFVGDTDIETTTVTPQAIVDERLFGFRHTLNIGLDFLNATEDIENTSEFFGVTSTGGFDLEKENIGCYAHDEFEVTPEFSVSGGYRYDTARFRFDSSVGGVERTEFDEVLYTLGVNYRFSPQSNLYISYAKSFRYPVLDEIFNFMTNTIDASLSPQKSFNYETGARYAFENGASLKVNLFYIKTADEIYYDPYLYTNTNLDGDTVRQGVEVAVDGRFGWGSAGMNYTYTRAEIKNGSFDGSEIPDVPEHQSGVTVLVDYFRPFALSVNGDYVGKRVFISDWANSFSRQEDYFVVNAKLAYALNGGTIYLNVNNLLNEAYSEYGVLGGFLTRKAYYPSPGTNVLMGLSLTF